VVLVAALILGVACGLVAVAVSASLRVVIGKPPGIRASAGGFSQQAELTGPATVKGGFGSSVALSAGGSTALIGTSSLNGVAGAVYVFTWRGGTWSQTAELTASGTSAQDDFGSSVALSAGGSTALVGAPGHNKNVRAAYVFALRGGTWSQAGELTGSGAAADDSFGWSVALSAEGSTALVGAFEHDENAGAGYVFTLRGGAWSQAGELTASGTAPGNQFGTSVALSAGGSTALVGAIGYNSYAGAGYVFTPRPPRLAG
jgi:hypothetical protein